MDKLVDVQCQCFELDEKLSTTPPDRQSDAITEHIALVETKMKFVIPEFPPGIVKI